MVKHHTLDLLTEVLSVLTWSPDHVLYPFNEAKEQNFHTKAQTITKLHSGTLAGDKSRTSPASRREQKAEGAHAQHHTKYAS